MRKHIVFSMKNPVLVLYSLILIFYFYFLIYFSRLKIIPFSCVLKHLGTPNYFEKYIYETRTKFNKKEANYIQNVKKISKTFYGLPLSNCIICALTAKYLLKKKNIHTDLVSGIIKKEYKKENSRNHVWLYCGGIPIIGHKEKPFFHPFLLYK